MWLFLDTTSLPREENSGMFPILLGSTNTDGSFLQMLPHNDRVGTLIATHLFVLHEAKGPPFKIKRAQPVSQLKKYHESALDQ